MLGFFAGYTFCKVIVPFCRIQQCFVQLSKAIQKYSEKLFWLWRKLKIKNFSSRYLKATEEKKNFSNKFPDEIFSRKQQADLIKCRIFLVIFGYNGIYGTAPGNL